MSLKFSNLEPNKLSCNVAMSNEREHTHGFHQISGVYIQMEMFLARFALFYSEKITPAAWAQRNSEKSQKITFLSFKIRRHVLTELRQGFSFTHLSTTCSKVHLNFLDLLLTRDFLQKWLKSQEKDWKKLKLFWILFKVTWKAHIIFLAFKATTSILFPGHWQIPSSFYFILCPRLVLAFNPNWFILL